MSDRTLGIIAAVLILTGLALSQVPAAEATAPLGYDILPAVQVDDGAVPSCHADGEDGVNPGMGGMMGSPGAQTQKMMESQGFGKLMESPEMNKMMELPPEEMAKACGDAMGDVAGGEKGRDA